MTIELHFLIYSALLGIAHLYFWGRILYAAASVAGYPLLRSLLWNVPTTGVLLFAVALFLNRGCESLSTYSDLCKQSKRAPSQSTQAALTQGETIGPIQVLFEVSDKSSRPSGRS